MELIDMEKRNRERLAMTAYCRISPTASRRKGAWKRIENISGAGMLVVWSDGASDTKPPTLGERFTAELQLPAHPVFGQRVLQFQTKVVRVVRNGNGRVLAGFESTRCKFKSIRPGAWDEGGTPAVVN